MFTENGNSSFYMPVAPAYGGDGMGFGNDWGWIILLLLFAGGGYGGFGGGFGGGYEFPWLLNGQAGINDNTNNGFQNALLNDNITSVRDSIGNLSTQVGAGFGDVATQLCGGFAGVNASINGAQNAISNQLYTNQLADLERSFAAQTASTQGMSNIQSQLAQCCCDNRLATAQTQALVQSENCADRQAFSDGLRDVLTATQAQTQAILDQMCQDKIDAKNDTIAQLRSELMFARGQASQDVQTAAIQAGQRGLANEIEQYVLPTPRPAYIVSNPNCCNNNYGCACGM